MMKKDNINDNIRASKSNLLFNQEFNKKIKADHIVYKKVINFISKKKIPKQAFVSIYYSNRYEVDTIAIIDWLIDNGYNVCIPRIKNKRKMEMVQIKDLNFDDHYCFNIRQPLDGKIVLNSEIKLFIVPLIAYNSNNYRLGHGNGYYDHFLSSFHGIEKVGLAYAFQLDDKMTINK